MAIAQLKPDAKPPSKPELPSTENLTYQAIAARNDQTPIGSLQAYLDGHPWTVNWYGQVITGDTALRELDVQLSAAHQPYQKTADLELRVQSALAPGYDSEKQLTQVTGSALITHLTPNQNDYFVAEASLQHFGLFVVTNVERRTHRQRSVYVIDYVLVGYLDAEQDRFQNLESKVVRRYRFSKERMVDGLSPILKEETHALLDRIHSSYTTILERYFKRFFNRGHMTLVVPGQNASVYDAWLVNFLAATTETDEVPEWRETRVLTLDHDRYLNQGNLWTALTARMPQDLQHAHQKASLVSRDYFNTSSWLQGPLYWSMQYYVYPIVTKDAARIPTDQPIPRFALKDLESQTEGVFPMIQYQGESYPLIKPVLVDDYYVLSEAFYTNTGVLSALELLVRDYLYGRTLDLALLEQLTLGYADWPVLEQFYYGPLVTLLCKEASRGFYP